MYVIKWLNRSAKLKENHIREVWHSRCTVNVKIFNNYCIYSNKRRSAYLIFRATRVALIWGRRLFEGGTYLKIVPDKSTFSIFLFNSTLSFYLLIFLWTDTKLIVNLELHSKNSERELTAQSEKYSHFELKNFTFKENKLPMLF